MTETLHRYPGAQPFRDDEFSRRTFFGRESASIALTDQILANRLVIIYAKSGLGKTSLLNAGVAPRLREAANLPLFVRVNDTKQGALSGVLEGVRAEAERQQVEYVPGDSSSLWRFFKTVEFWRGDTLLTPVLILDQFEELFTLQSQEQREKFLSELGYLVRGIPPPSQAQAGSGISDSPPSIRVVLALREDFLGVLEEASDHIPEILDHRYRVAPLTYEMASKAITGPAAVEHTGIATRTFRLEPEFVTAVLNYLTRSAGGARNTVARNVEPFHLQLICQRIEKVAAFKEQTSSGEVVLGLKDLGGEVVLSETLESFYADAIRSLMGRKRRSAVRILCEQFLISPEGRRLSVEERELCRQLKLSHETLSHLVERRLLRTDRRSDSTYYELSHDALVQPVLASRRMQALVVGWAGVVAGSITTLTAAVLVFFCIAGLYSEKSLLTSTSIGIFIIIIFAAFICYFGTVWLRAGLRRRMRYRHRAQGEFDEVPLVALPLRARFTGWVMILVGPALFTLWGLAGLFGLFVYGTVFLTHGRVPHWLVWMKDTLLEAWQLMYDSPVVEVLWWVVEYSTIAALGFLLFRQGMRKLWPHKFGARSKASLLPGVDEAPSLAWASAKAFSGGIALIIAALGLFTMRTCVSAWHGGIPYWLSWSIVSYSFSEACQTVYQKGWDWDSFSFALFFFSVLIFSIVLLYKGVVEIRTALHHHRVARIEIKHKRTLAAAAALAILVAASLFFWVRAKERNEVAQKRRLLAAMTTSGSVVSPAGWVAGDDAEILHTEDGLIWKQQSKGKGLFNSTNFPTRQMGWAVGVGGAIWRTEDGGATWNTQNSGTVESLSVIVSMGPRAGWTVGHGGLILHTEDGGKSWKTQESGTQAWLTAVTFTTPQSGLAVGTDGTILRTDDGGGLWVPEKSGTSATLYFVSFVTPQSGWASGADGTIVHTDDGGGVWKAQKSGTIRQLAGIAFVTPRSGWVVGDKGTILHTEDAGATWVRQASGVRADLGEVAFITPLSGWVVGDSGVILHTEDGGMTWEPESSSTRANLRSITFVKPYGMIGINLKIMPKPAPAGSTNRGAPILRVLQNGPADKAGLKVGDVIVAVNGKDVKDDGEIVTAIASLKPGSDARLTYLRDGKQGITNVTIADGSGAIGARP